MPFTPPLPFRPGRALPVVLVLLVGLGALATLAYMVFHGPPSLQRWPKEKATDLEEEATPRKKGTCLTRWAQPFK